MHAEAHRPLTEILLTYRKDIESQSPVSPVARSRPHLMDAVVRQSGGDWRVSAFRGPVA
jgi:hypothetical protein